MGIGTVSYASYKLFVDRTIRSTGVTTLMEIRNDSADGLRIKQYYGGINNTKYSIFQFVNSVENAAPSITFCQGRVGIITTDLTTYHLVVAGDVRVLIV